MPKSIIVLMVFLHSSFSFACLSLPRNIQFQNSPYFFDHINLSGFAIEIPFSNGNQDVRLRCRKEENGTHQWYLRASDDLSTPQADGVEEMPLSQRGSDGNDQYFMDTSEIPAGTQIGPFISGQDEATLEIRNPNSPFYIQISCSVDKKGVSQVMANFKNSENETIASVGAAQSTLYRSISSGRSPDATVDFSNLTAQSVVFPGCGGAVQEPTRSQQNNTNISQ